MRKELVVGVCVFLGLLQVSAFALIDTAPSWRDENNLSTTYAVWEFSTSGVKLPGGLYYYADVDSGWNPNGTPELVVRPLTGYYSALDNATGVWGLSGHISATIPNTSNTGEGTSKSIQIQLVWKSEPVVGTEELGIPTIYVNVDGLCFDAYLFSEETLSNGWTYSIYTVELPTNPTEESVEINGKIYVDSLIVDTICIPEPASMCLMAAGLAGMFLSRKK